MSKQKRRTTRSTAAKKELLEAEKAPTTGSSPSQDESALAKVEGIVKRFAVPPEIEKLLLQSIVWSQQVREEARRNVESKLVAGNKTRKTGEDRKRKKNDEEQRQANSFESEKRIKLQEEGEAKRKHEMAEREQRNNARKEEEAKRLEQEMDERKKNELKLQQDRRLKVQQEKEKAAKLQQASELRLQEEKAKHLHEEELKLKAEKMQREKEMKLQKVKEDEQRRKLALAAEEKRLAQEKQQRKEAEENRQHPVPKQFGSVEKQGRKAPMAGVHGFLPSKGGSEKKATAAELRHQGEERLREKHAAEGERLKETEEAKRRKIEEKHLEREEKARRAEERRREAERAKTEKAAAVEKQRQLQLAAVQNFKLQQQLKKKGQLEAKKRNEEDDLKAKQPLNSPHKQKEGSKHNVVQQKASNATYDADEEDEDENDGGGKNSTFNVSDKEAPSQKPTSASKATAAKSASGPKTPKTPKQTISHSYDITPHRLELPPEPLHDPENYDINDLKSDEDTDDDEQPRKEIPRWAEGKNLRLELMKQTYSPLDLDLIFAVMEMPDLTTIFREHRKRFFKRTSSAQWGKLPTSHKI